MQQSCSPSPSSINFLLPLLPGCSLAYSCLNPSPSAPSNLATSNHTLPPPSYANPLSSIFSTKETISSTYSDTRVTISGGRMCSRDISSKNLFSQKAANSRETSIGFLIVSPSCKSAMYRRAGAASLLWSPGMAQQYPHSSSPTPRRPLPHPYRPT
jgi:hypothetical protein